jgi:hypothetical protein
MRLKGMNKSLFIVLFSLITTACQSQKDPAFEPLNVTSNLSPVQTTLTSAFINQYLELKNALVATNSTLAHEATLLMSKDIDTLRQTLSQDTSQALITENLKVQLDSIHLQLSQMLAHDDKSCEPQRIYFKFMSDNVFSMLKLMDVHELHLYAQYCPLALNEKGGHWLSTSRKIENPYFGSKMLTCGGVTDTLK